MGIRSTAKAIIIHDGKILLNKCNDSQNGEYYSMPGGGQKKYETLFKAVVRECKEETGYEVKPLKLLGLCEEICLEAGEKHSEYAHKMHHIFLCELADGTPGIPAEKDSMQICSEWISIEKLNEIRLLPKIAGEQIVGMINGKTPIFLGSEYINFIHG